MVKRRYFIQALGALAFNGNLKGFLQGRIYQGTLKTICVPVLNCYSCPGALGSCPIGSFQAVAGSQKFSLSCYVMGLMILFGITLGRFFCGFLCPFGFLQDVLFAIPMVKRELPLKIHKKLKNLKYFMLIGMVVFFPWIQKLLTGLGDPFFCKYICPAGIIEGGFPLLVKIPYLRTAMGGLFYWKALLAVSILFSCLMVYRFFCKYLCPLGAFYGLFHKFSFYQLEVEKHSCIECNRCVKACSMRIVPYRDPNSPECIRCLECVYHCPTGAIHTNLSHGVISKCKRCGKVK